MCQAGGEVLDVRALRLALVAAALACPTTGCTDGLDYEPEDRGDRTPHPEEGYEAPDPMDLGGYVADARFISEYASQSAGWSVAAAGDVNGDGFADVAIGAPQDTEGNLESDSYVTYAGAAYLLLGPLSGEVQLADADVKFIGEAGASMAGWFTAAAGDVDADGLDEFLIGTQGFGWFETEVVAGKAYVLDGSWEGHVGLSEVSPAIEGEHLGPYAGANVASAGDVDGDGQADLLVGDIGDDAMGERTGAAYVLLGPILADVFLADAHAKLTGEAEFDDAGWALAATGDVDDDGFDDFLVGAPNDQGHGPGRVYLVHGPATGISSLADAPTTFSGENEGDQAGAAVAGGDDLDGDGHEDFVIGAPSAEPSDDLQGIVYVVLGPVEGDVSLADADARLIDEETSDHLGCSVALCGDVNGDGAGDLLVGAETSVHLVTQPVVGEVILPHVGHRFETHGRISLYSRSIAGAGDVNADGVDDFLIGVSADHTDHQFGGTAYLFHSHRPHRSKAMLVASSRTMTSWLSWRACDYAAS